MIWIPTRSSLLVYMIFFFFNDTATTEIYTLSLHDALPICRIVSALPTAHLSALTSLGPPKRREIRSRTPPLHTTRSEEHTSELQSRQYLVCRLLLEKKHNSTTLPAITPILSYI